MRKYIYTLLAAIAFLAVSPAFADFDPKAPLPVDPLLTQEQFDALLPLMTCDDMKNRDLVNQQQTVQQNFQNLVFQSYDKPELKAHLNKLMTDAIGKDLPAQTKAWLLRNLQWTAGDNEVPAIAACLNKNVALVVDEAAHALIKIGTPKAIDALKAAEKDAAPKVKLIIKSALTSFAEKYDVPTETKMPLAIPYASKADVDNFLKGYNDFSEQLKVETLANLGIRSDKAYLPLVCKEMQEGTDPVKRAALFALEKLGTKDQIPLILKFHDRGAAQLVASRIESDGFDEGLINALANCEQGDFGFISGMLASRSVDISTTLFSKAKAKDCPNRLELLQNAKKLVGLDKINDFIDVLALFPNGRDKEEAEKIIASMTPGNASAVVAKMEQYPGATLLGCLGRIGGGDAKAALEKALKSSDNDVKEAAIKAICNWPNAEVADDLFAISQDSSFKDGQKIQALRAFIRVVSLPDDQIGVKFSVDDKLSRLQKAFDAATRVDEKNLVISRVGSVRDVKSLDFVLRYANDPKLAETVYRAIADLAHHNFLRQPHKDKFEPAMKMVIEKSKDEVLVDRVKRYLDLM